MRRRTGVLIVAVVVIAVLAGLAVVLVAFRQDTMPFSPALWQAPSSSRYRERDITDRQKMVDDLMRHHLPGKTRDQVMRMLGPQGDTSYFRSLEYDLIYRLGPERGWFGIDSEWLLVWFGEDGIFEECRIVTD